MSEPSETSELSEANDLTARVIGVIATTQRLPPASVTPDSTFEELKIDSLDGINVVFALEDAFKIEIPDEGVRNMRSVRQAIEGVQQLLSAREQTVPPGAA